MGNLPASDDLQADVFLAISGGTFRDVGVFDLGNNIAASSLVTGDFNDDGRADLAFFRKDAAGTDRLQVLLTQGGETLLSLSGFTLLDTGMVVPAVGFLVTPDIDGDGRSDLVSYADGRSQVAISLSNGTFVDPGALAAAIEENPVVADPGDGTEDVFVVDQNGNILWRKGDALAAGSFNPPLTITSIPRSRDIAFVPTAQGGLLASADLWDDHVSLLAYRGGEFVPVGELATGILPAEIVVGDINGDGNGDLVVRDAGDGQAAIFLGDGDGDFFRLANVPIGLGATDIALAKLAPSRQLDLVVTNQFDGLVSVFPGRGDGNFSAPYPYRAGAGPYTLIAPANGSASLTSDEATAGVAVGSFQQGGGAWPRDHRSRLELVRDPRRAGQRCPGQSPAILHQHAGKNRPGGRFRWRRHQRPGPARSRRRNH